MKEAISDSGDVIDGPLRPIASCPGLRITSIEACVQYPLAKYVASLARREGGQPRLPAACGQASCRSAFHPELAGSAMR